MKENRLEGKMTIFAPAKVNLRLKVTGRRADGYHDLDMVMVKLGLADRLDLTFSKTGVQIESDQSHVPLDRSNTVWKAIDLVKKETGSEFGLKVQIQKRIPIGAGLGGGSSDAASVLLALNDHLSLGLNDQKLNEIGKNVGADVPFFLVPGTQRVTGIGEILEPIDLSKLYFILINPGIPIATAQVYGWYDGIDSLPPDAEHRTPSSLLTEKKLDARFPPLENDLEEVVFPRYPVLAALKESLRKAGALGTQMSGSGSTVFGLFTSEKSRDRGFEIVDKMRDPDWWICKTESL